MKKFLQHALTGLMLLAPAALAVQLSDLSPTMDRTMADDNLTKDYAYRVLSDLSVRRIWNVDENRKLSIDFDAKNGELICIVVDYRKPVSLEEADKDAADIGKFEEAAWRKFDANKAAKYYMGRARAMKFKEGYMFQEVNGANKCMRLTFYTKAPKENRRHLSEGSTLSGSSAMGNTLSGSAVKKILEDEEKRLYTANKTDKVTVDEPKVKEVPADEPEIVEQPEEEPEEVIEEPKETGKVVKAPVKVKPVKAVKQKGDRKSDFENLLAKLGLDGLTTMHWILIGVGLVVLITILGAVGRGNDRRKMEKRAASLRNNTASVKSSLRNSINKNKKGLKLK